MARDYRCYLYLSHLGGYYITKDKIPNRELYCPICKSSDYLLYQGTKQSILNSIREHIRFRIKMYKLSFDDTNECIKPVQFDLLLNDLVFYHNIKHVFKVYERNQRII